MSYKPRGSARRNGAQPSILAISIIIGAFTSSITSGLAGGLSGSTGFLVGTIVPFLLGSGLVIYANGGHRFQAESTQDTYTSRRRSIPAKTVADSQEAGDEEVDVEQAPSTDVKETTSTSEQFQSPSQSEQEQEGKRFMQGEN